jgi:DNA-binding transcriptional MerR regulator
MRAKALKVGALAKQTGLSVRALHYYEEIGLLVPSDRSESGHRLYNTRDVARLQQIVSLRALGLSLEEIQDCLDQRGQSLLQVMERHLERIRETLSQQQRLYQQLDGIAEVLRRGEEVSLEQLVQSVEETNMYEKYFSKEQLEELQSRKESIPSQENWGKLIAEIKAHMSKGTDPQSPEVKALAARWHELRKGLTGGDPQLTESIRKMYQSEPTVKAQGEQMGIDSELIQYIVKAMSPA